ncbi:MAG: hypothetical protein GY751_18680, partial [Bacteroidetes bacterium]|nr:hypothetical protein [Bacteroidota bacterium]
MSSGICAELKLEAVEPAEGGMGKDLEVTLTGTGFDENTRASMFIDYGNRKAIIGSVDTPGHAHDVTVSNGIAFVADWDGGLQVIEISNSVTPEIIGSVDTPGAASGVTVSNGMAFVADMSCGLQVIDISNPATPEVIGSVDTPDDANGVTVSDGKAFVAAHSGGLQIIDISNPDAPKIIGSVDTSGYAQNVTVSEGKAFVACSEYNQWSDLQVIDISNPATPEVIGSVDTPGSATDVTVSDGMAFVAATSGCLQIIDISNPATPEIIGSVDTPGIAYAVTVSDGMAFVTAGDDGLQVIDISNPTSPNVIGSVDTLYNARSVTVTNGKAFVADGYDGLQVIDISNPATPDVIGSVDTPDFADAVTVYDGKAFVADRDDGGLQIIDISNPAALEIIGSVDTPGNATDVTVSDEKAFVADGHGGLQVIDISNPSLPEIIGSLGTPESATGVTVYDGKVFVANYYGKLQVIDISNPSVPEIIGLVDTPGNVYGGVIVSDGKAFLACARGGRLWNGLQVIDISNPVAPEIIGSVGTPGHAYGVTVSDGKAFVADGHGGLQVIDINNPSAPEIIGSVDTPSIAYAVKVSGGKAFVAADKAGLIIVPLPVEIDPVTINSKTSISLTLPPPQLSGNYTIRAFNGNESYELPGIIRFSPNQKAIIVAGGGPSTDTYPNFIWEMTRFCSNHAYRVLLDQGYKKENICYLSPEMGFDADGNGKADDVNDYITPDSLQNAILNWAEDAHDLILYMIDHGGDGTFRLNPSEILEAKDLDADLDELQETMSGRVIFIYDACESGSFISHMKPPEGKERIIIASSNIREDANYFEEGRLSFSFQFWTSIYAGARLNKAFFFARDMMEDFQTAIVDADGDGISQSNEGKHLSNIVIGRGTGLGRDMPVIESVCNDHILAQETTATLWAGDINSVNDISRVWAVIAAPDHNSEPDEPVMNLPTLELTDSNNDGTYEGTYKKFNKKGIYKISIYTEDTEGIFSLPRHTTVTQLTDNNELSRVTITGSISDENRTPLCAMALANGQYIFSCDPAGEYELLYVPLDDGREITLFVFVDGFAPFKKILAPTGDHINFDVTMYIADENDVQ